MNWPFIIFFSIVTLALVVFLIMRNQKDEKDLEDQSYEDFRKPAIDERDIETDEILK